MKAGEGQVCLLSLLCTKKEHRQLHVVLHCVSMDTVTHCETGRRWSQGGEARAK